jgi:RNA polymerase sigma factor (sigma-70 family)
MNFVDLQSEFRDVRIGRLIYGEVTALAEAIVSRYNPTVYLNATTWQDGFDDFVQGFVTTVLLKEGQLEYVMEVAGSLDDFRNLLARQMRRLLARRRRRTVLDNLLDRCKAIVSEEPFSFEREGRSWSYHLRSLPVASGGPDEVALKNAAIDLALFPLVRADPSERAPIVYTTETLREILTRVAKTLRVRVTVANLDAIFRQGLTFLLPSDLSTDEGAFEHAASPELNPEEESIVRDGVRVLLESLTADEKLVLRMKLVDRSDTEIAAAAGVSRPTIDKRKKQAMKTLEFALEDLPEKLQAAVMERISIELAK